MLRRFSLVVAFAFAAACAPSAPDRGEPQGNDCSGADTSTDVNNCGSCHHVCGGGETCSNGSCVAENCSPGAMEACYSGSTGSEGVGACKGGMRSCTPAGFWGVCEGEVVPQLEVCGNSVDDNCNGTTDEDVDQDGDGFTTCQGDCCDNTSECSQPALVNPGAFEAAGNQVDDDCDGQIDNSAATMCDTGLASNATSGMEYAKAMDLCQTATMSDRKWGVISATWSGADGMGTVNPLACSIRPAFGTNVTPRAGAALFEIATGNAADSNDTMPSMSAWEASDMSRSSGYPADFLAAHGGQLPNAPGCPPPSGGTANDPVMLTLKVRVPTNAQSFSLSTNFFTAEYPEWVCTAYNDFFVVLLDSSWNGTPANPGDKNLAVYTAPNGSKYPVGVNLATGSTGLFSECQNAQTGCGDILGTHGNNTSCTATTQLAGTGLDAQTTDLCNSSTLSGGGTGWLTTSGNVKGGEIMTLRIAIWDTSDHVYSSLAAIDNFQWAVTAADPGTVVN
jgi:hypothetical protein